MRHKYQISTDKKRLNLAKIHDYLSNVSYWAKGRTLEQVEASIENSLCFGVFYKNEQVAFARVVTDTVSFAYLLDVFVFDEFKKQGISKLLLDEIFSHHALQNVNWLLRTSDAQGLYEKYGFNSIDNPATYMKKLSLGNN
ncbi:GNAT family N-acetyltransferase [Pseudoalteromonas sp. C2R02]|uniref:GNAT family N-acetyltransferase n=1 Tax=Pseudoalteromonas sp. C2R02 TaxID=2841565 RepID=UPI001C09B1AD|nr:GNAT family N-acetyltransferase [Pseudoalteromonas sp. C2R02]MBU2970818.1 GNAT family N-acetyltransferase [Pseudoalteromonas sp. C2R02]